MVFFCIFFLNDAQPLYAKKKNARFLKTAFNANPFRYNHPQIPHKQKTLLEGFYVRS